MIVALMALALLADAAGDVAKLSWMAGTWVEEKNGATVRETWLSPKDGVMAGVGQTNRPGKAPYVEFTKISAEPAGATFSAMIPGRSPTTFVMIPGAEGEAVFENKSNGFPQRIIYRQCGRELCARIEGSVQGKPQFNAWRYRRGK